MKQSIASFVTRLADISPGLSAARDGAVAYWTPDEPPVTTLLGEIGEAFVADYDAVDDAVNRAVLSEIEQAMASDDDELVTAVATGMIEGMIGSGEGSWERIRPRLGARSAAHADAWTA
jgi:hypothetical protein